MILKLDLSNLNKIDDRSLEEEVNKKAFPIPDIKADSMTSAVLFVILLIELSIKQVDVIYGFNVDLSTVSIMICFSLCWGCSKSTLYDRSSL